MIETQQAVRVVRLIMSQSSTPPLAYPVPAAPRVAQAVQDRPVRAIPIIDPVPESPVTTPAIHPVRRAYRSVRSGCEWLFGLMAMMVGLGILAAIPVVQFLALGYLLEAGGRVARSGRLRDGFIGMRTAALLGGMALGCWLVLLPVRFVADLAHSASIIDPGSALATRWRIASILLAAFLGGHVLATLARGGRFPQFFWPLNTLWFVRRVLRGGWYQESRDAVWDMLVRLRLPHYFMQGVKGFFAALAWLVTPVTLLAVGHAPFAGAPLVGFLGAILLGIVVLFLPFLQVRMAATGRFAAILGWRAIRREYLIAPWAFTLAFFMTVLFALPLYLLKIEVVPREAAWLPSMVFVLFIFPARLLTGWALGRAARRDTPRHFVFRWSARLPLIPIAAVYVLFVFFSQYTSWNGIASLYEQHAFLVPVPFLSL